MKKKLLIALACLGLSTISFAKEPTIRFATEASYPPFEYIDANNEIQGFDIDLAKAICQSIQEDCTFTHQAFDSLIPSLKFRRFDALVAAIDVTPERQQQVLFSNIYYNNAAIFIANKEQAANITDFKDKKIGVQNGTTHQKYLAEKHPEASIVTYSSYQNAILDLKSGRLNAVFGDTAVIAEWLKSDDTLTTVGKDITDPDYFGTGMAIAVRKNNTELMTKFNQGLQTIKDNGTYQTIYNKWFSANK